MGLRSRPTNEDGPRLFERGVKALEAGKPSDAALLFERAEANFVAQGDHHSAAVCALNRASALEDLGEIERALAVLMVAASRDTESIDLPLQAEIDLLLGVLQESLGRNLDALALYQSAKDAFEALGDLPKVAYVSMNLGGAFESALEQENAISEYQSAAQSFASLGLDVERNQALERLRTILRSE